MLIIPIKKTLESHYRGCKNLALFFLNSKIKKFIQIGSSIEYGLISSPQKKINLISKKLILSTALQSYLVINFY